MCAAGRAQMSVQGRWWEKEETSPPLDSETSGRSSVGHLHSSLSHIGGTYRSTTAVLPEISWLFIRIDMYCTIDHNNAPVGIEWRNSNSAQTHAKEGLDDGELANVHGGENYPLLRCQVFQPSTEVRCVQIKTLARCFVGIDKRIIKFAWKDKRLKTTKTTQRRAKMRTHAVWPLKLSIR